MKSRGWELLGKLIGKVGTKAMGDAKWKEYSANITLEQENFKLLRVEHKDDGKILVIHATPKEPFKDENEELITVHAVCRTIINAVKADYIYFDKIGLSGGRDYIYKYTCNRLMKEAVKRSKQCFKIIIRSAEKTLWNKQGEVVD